MSPNEHKIRAIKMGVVRPRLDSLKVGNRGVVAGIVTDCDRANRMATLGFIPGQTVQLTRFAPLGDPMSVQIDGREISLRLAEARLIEVEDISE